MHTITVPVPPAGGFRLKDLANIYTPRRTQLIHGGLYVNAAPAAWHNLIAHRLTDVIQAAAGDDVIVIPGMAVELAENHAPEPDIVVVTRAAYDSAANSFLPEQVPLVVEIMSRDKRKDRIVRPDEYAQAGTEHFWRIERTPESELVCYVYELDPMNQQYVLTETHHDRVRTTRPWKIDCNL